MQNISIGIARKLLKMQETAESISASSLKGSFVNELLENDILQVEIKGRGKKYRLHSVFLEKYLKNNYNINSLKQFVDSFEQETSRSENIQNTGNSKSKKTNVAKGLLITSFLPINGILNDKPFTLNPPEGSSVFIHDIDNFKLDDDVIIVGIENQENFNLIHQQKHLFTGKHYCFVSRYFSSTKSFQNWLENQRNKYLHFGDFDLAGISIYINEIKPYLKQNQGRFFIPDKVEELFKNHGNKDLYLKQNCKYKAESFQKHGEITELYNIIQKYKAGVEQEVLVK